MSYSPSRAACLFTIAGLLSVTGTSFADATGTGRATADACCEAMIIVTPRAFRDEVDRYVAAVEPRRRQGCRLQIDVAELETILDAATTGDDAEKVKRFLVARGKRINEANDARGCRLRYVLLVGDADIFPVRYMCLDRNTDAAFNCAFYPSDLYYADLFKADGSFEDWNANKDGFHAGYFGEVRGEHNKSDPINFDGIDYKPDVAVGRWPVSRKADLRTVIDKTIAYEQGLLQTRSSESPRAKATAAMIAVGGWVENTGPMDAMAARLGERWLIERRYEGRGDQGKPPTADEVVSLLNQHAQLVFHSGHGGPDGWERSLGVRNIPELTNAAHPAIVLSAGCSTAYFATLPPYEAYLDANGVEHKGTDNGEVFTSPPPPPGCYARGAHNRTGFGEALLRDGPNGGAGAVAYFGCNTGSQPCGMTLLEGFADAIGSSRPGDPPKRLGDCWIHAVNYYHEHQRLAELKPNNDWYPPSIFFQGMKFMLFGDPSIPIP